MEIQRGGDNHRLGPGAGDAIVKAEAVIGGHGSVALRSAGRRCGGLGGKPAAHERDYDQGSDSSHRTAPKGDRGLTVAGKVGFRGRPRRDDVYCVSSANLEGGRRRWKELFYSRLE
jgi:hypothetical protein